jgi:hypothetical protein
LASQAEISWVIALLAASPASFQPSKAAISAGEVSLPTASSSIASHLPYPRTPDARLGQAYAAEPTGWKRLPAESISGGT